MKEVQIVVDGVATAIELGEDELMNHSGFAMVAVSLGLLPPEVMSFFLVPMASRALSEPAGRDAMNALRQKLRDRKH